MFKIVLFVRLFVILIVERKQKKLIDSRNYFFIYCDERGFEAGFGMFVTTVGLRFWSGLQRRI